MTKQCVTSNEGKRTTTQHRKPCADCPWSRKALPGWLGSTTVEQWILDAHGETKIDCHTHLGMQCAGAAIYRGNVCKRPRALTLLRLPADRELVFASQQQFREHHGKKATR